MGGGRTGGPPPRWPPVNPRAAAEEISREAHNSAMPAPSSDRFDMGFFNPCICLVLRDVIFTLLMMT